MNWNRTELERLSPILEQISADLSPVDGKNILVLGSAAGEVAFRLAEMMELGKVTGLEPDQDARQVSIRAAHEMGLAGMLEFLPLEGSAIPFPDTSFDALVSELIVYPSPSPAEIGLAEIARVLIPGGKMIMTAGLLARMMSPQVHQELGVIGLDHLFSGTPDDFRRRMAAAGLVNIKLQDLTTTLRNVLSYRRSIDLAASHASGYSALLDDPHTCLGRALFYIYASGAKSKNLP